MAGRAIPYFDFYPTDFMHGIRGLTAQEVGIYTMLLCRIYEENGPVEYHAARLSTYCGTREATFVKAFDRLVVLGKLVVEDGCFMNPRAHREIETRETKLKNNSRAGKISAEKRQQKQYSEPTDVERAGNHTDTDTDTDTDKEEDTDVSLSGASHRPLDDISKAVHDYNDAAQRAGWPTVQKMTDARRRALRSRLKDCGGNDGWKAAMERAAASDFLCGRTSKPWTGFSFDWIAKPGNFNKLVEGNYDNRPQSPQHNRQLSRADATSLGFDVVARTRRASSEPLF